MSQWQFAIDQQLLATLLLTITNYSSLLPIGCGLPSHKRRTCCFTPPPFTSEFSNESHARTAEVKEARECAMMAQPETI